MCRIPASGYRPSPPLSPPSCENPWMPGGGGSRYVLGYLRHGHACSDFQFLLYSLDRGLKHHHPAATVYREVDGPNWMWVRSRGGAT